MIQNDLNYYIDLHCHYEGLKPSMIREIFENNKIIALTNSTEITDYQKLENLRKEDISNLYFAYGLYPEVLNNKSYEDCINDLDKIDFSKSIAIGEIGLDYKITKNKEIRLNQKKLLTKQLEFAKEFNKPVIIHSRFATKPTLELLSSWDDVKVILHWFTGNENEIQTALDRKYYLTIRYNRPTINNVKDYLDQIFIETDYPVRYNNLDNSILNIKESYNVFAKENNLELQFLKEKIETNFCKLFNINLQK